MICSEAGVGGGGGRGVGMGISSEYTRLHKHI
jgi:hypothetical protein